MLRRTLKAVGKTRSRYGAYGNPSWTYDKVGNRLTDQLISGGTTTLRTYAYPSTSNRLATITQSGSAVRTFTYDASGAVSNDNRSGTNYAYTISNAGRIRQLTVGGTVKANYTYDHENRLAIRQTLNATPSGTTHMIYDMRDRLIAEMDGATGAAIREYIWLDDLPVAVLDNSAAPAAATLLYVHTDWLGRPEAMTNASRTEV